MPKINAVHECYEKAVNAWQTMRDVLGGEESVKEAGTRHLPMLDDSDAEAYEAYKARASFFNATGRARMAMVGFLFRKDPVLMPDKEATVLKPPLQAFIADATLTGKGLYDVAKEMAEQVMGMGRAGSIVDWSEEEQQPFLVNYEAEDIRHWAYERRGGRMVLTLLVLFERDPTYIATTDDPAPLDRFDRKLYPQWRVWSLEQDNNGMDYVVTEVWRLRKGAGEIKETPYDLPGTGQSTQGAKVTTPDDFIKVEDYQPRRGATPLAEIPFVFHGPNGPHTADVARPPLLDMARINLSHYRTDADLENALHIIGVPTPWAAGFDDKSDELRLGANVAWKTENENAKCGFLELSGTGLIHLKETLERKEKHMAALGARMLDQQTSGGNQPEAFATVALRQSGETAVLTKISLSLTQSLTDLLAWAYWWVNRGIAVPSDAEAVVSYTLNTDFIGGTMEPGEITSLVQAYIANAISYETLFYRLQTGEVIPSERKIDDERSFIEEGQTAMLALTALKTEAEAPPTNTQQDNAGGSPPDESNPNDKGKPKPKPAA